MSQPSRHVPPSTPSEANRLSIDDYLELPDDGKRYQILDGGLDVTPAPSPRHQMISQQLEMILVLALQQTGQGRVFDAPIDVVLGRHDIVQPDILFIRRERVGIIGPTCIEGAPDLVVEVLSPSTRRVDVLVKSGLYARCGVASYWVVDPDLDRMEFYRLEGSGYRLAGAASRPEVVRPEEFPGLEIPLETVFG